MRNEKCIACIKYEKYASSITKSLLMKLLMQQMIFMLWNEKKGAQHRQRLFAVVNLHGAFFQTKTNITFFHDFFFRYGLLALLIEMLNVNMSSNILSTVIRIFRHLKPIQTFHVVGFLMDPNMLIS